MPKNEFWVKFALSAKLKKLLKGLYFEMRTRATLPQNREY
jgi:hypothetical protein